MNIKTYPVNPFFPDTQIYLFNRKNGTIITSTIHTEKNVIQDMLVKDHTNLAVGLAATYYPNGFVFPDWEALINEYNNVTV